MRLSRLAAAVAVMLVPLGARAQAPAPTQQQQEEMMKMVVVAAHNQLGVLEYCQASGSIGADTVALQNRMIAMMPPGPTDGLAEAEATGKQGIVVFAGTKIPLADAARSQNTTPDAMCKQMASMLQAQAAQLPKQ